MEQLRRKINKSNIVSGSYNTVIQDSKLINPVFISNTADEIKLLGSLEKYDAIQEQVENILTSAKQTHPLYPDYSAAYDNQLHRLVSTPETEDALKKYPKKIKGKFEIDYKKYPDMDRSEMPWEYAYRTQTPVELLTTEYTEYLGDIEDPFPITKCENDMVTVIKAPEFPPAVEAKLITGEYSIPIMIRRIPCKKYGEIKIGTIDKSIGLDITLTLIKDTKKVNITFSKIYDCELDIQLRREKIINEIKNSKHINIKVVDKDLVNVALSDENLSDELFVLAPYMIKYIENLLLIEKDIGCKFNTDLKDFDYSKYVVANIMASSLQGKWHRIQEDFDNEIRCDYNHIPEDIIKTDSSHTKILIEGKVLKLSLQGQCFTADQYFYVFTDACINNLRSVEKNIKKKKKNILITFRPLPGKKYFYKYCMFKEIKMAS